MPVFAGVGVVVVVGGVVGGVVVGVVAVDVGCSRCHS